MTTRIELAKDNLDQWLPRFRDCGIHSRRSHV